MPETGCWIAPANENVIPHGNRQADEPANSSMAFKRADASTPDYRPGGKAMQDPRRGMMPASVKTFTNNVPPFALLQAG